MNKKIGELLDSVKEWANSTSAGMLVLHKGADKSFVVWDKKIVKMAELPEDIRLSIGEIFSEFDPISIEIRGVDGQVPDRIVVTRYA